MFFFSKLRKILLQNFENRIMIDDSISVATYEIFLKKHNIYICKCLLTLTLSKIMNNLNNLKHSIVRYFSFSLNENIIELE